ncbi:GAF domain-containing protein [Sorangium sp. So ce131]|uniref:hybrid sensor histidine kinase/response regulator n=1 Tax=Sorangium sp. So ce131 TaxID=3133282 RepID=UPI003F61006C
MDSNLEAPSPPDRPAAPRRGEDLLDIVPQSSLVRVAALAARSLLVPIALITRRDGRLAGGVGVPEGWGADPRGPLPQAALDHVARGDLLAVEDARLDPALRDGPALRELGAASWLAAPLRGGDGACVGALSVLDRRARSWEERDAGILRDLAALLSQEMELREAAAASARAAGTAERLEVVTAALAAAATLEDAAKVAVEQIGVALGSSAGALAVLDVEAQCLRVVAGRGLSTAALAPYRAIPLSVPLPVTDAVRDAAPVLVGSPEEMLARYPGVASTLNLAFRSWATIPLLVEGVAIGALWLSFEQPRTFGGEDRLLMMTVAGQTAQAIARAQLFEAERQARARAARLEALAAALSTATTLEQAAQVAVEQITTALGAQGGALGVLHPDPGAVRVLAWCGVRPARSDGFRVISLDEPLPATDAVRHARPILLSSPEALTARYPHLEDLVEPQLRASAAIPFLLEERAVGVAWFHFAEPREFTREDEALMMTIGHQAAQAIARSLLFEAERAARALAESAERRKDEFLAMLGHELRNPLAPILTALELMQRSQDGGGERAGVVGERARVVIERQVRHLERLVDDLLDVSRITRGKIALKPERLRVAELAAKAIELASPLLEQRKHRLEVLMPPEELVVEGDHVRLVQVLTNLVTNAAKYTDPGGHIAVSAEPLGREVVIKVRDTGAGIPPSLLPHVFDMFVQGPQRLDREKGGLGLGLTIVKRLLEMHGGSVEARSDGPGEGSEFIARLPRAAHGRGAPPEPAQPGARPPAARRRVLVVDDNDDGAELLADALTTAGYAVSVALDGPSALDEARRFRPEIVVLDIGLPVMDGYEVAQKLRAEVLTDARVVLIALTGYGQEQDRLRALSSGFDEHLVKPASVQQVLGAIAQATARRDPAAAGAGVAPGALERNAPGGSSPEPRQC